MYVNIFIVLTLLHCLVIPVRLNDARIIEGVIISMIADLRQSIRDAGLDPYNLEEASAAFELPVPVIFNAQASVSDISSNGLSNIVVENISFTVLTQRLRMTIALPKIDVSIGSIEINVIRVSVDVRIDIGLISGISIRNLNIDFTLGGIDSNLNVVIADRDISAPLNNLLGNTIPTTLRDYRAEINQLLEIIILQIASDMLG
ncbi:hypothetical protein K1T71_003506 [Dendrolimus kikuchii]|uniref:Uncharacterized protein n=1 Tax=Dendrolimus kikuchii TaxID=765133 RepID=A0ACC1DC03_9NEOP|nr:hypothetical protein K1T71_003506 [Dendrolimus kikuchii]